MSKSDQAKAREHRLAAKLRENLRRRKEPAVSPEAGQESAVQRAAPSGSRGEDKKP